MARVIGIGETVLDIIFKEGKVLTSKVGGSTLNSIVSLARLGIDVSFVSDIGEDNIGGLVENFLIGNKINIENLVRMKNYSSALSIAFLDEKNDANYNFYKNYPAQRMEKLNIELYNEDILMFGSNFAISPATRKPLLNILHEANSVGAVVLYDPNFRKPHLPELKSLKSYIIENIGFADIVRGSDEDFYYIFGANNADQAYKYVSEAGCYNLIYTANKNQVYVYSRGVCIGLEVNDINPVSTIGAGDNFNAGIIWTLVREELKKRDLEHLPENLWRQIAQAGIDFSSEVCMHMDNYISKEFADNIINE